MEEEWRPILGFEGYYDVSNIGRVRTVERAYTCNHLYAGEAHRMARGGLKKVSIAKKKYPRCYVNLQKHGKGYTKLVPRLVAEAFIGPIPKGMHVAHNDGDPTNNVVSNLRIATILENAKDKRLHGTQPMGEKSHLAKLKEWQAREIKASTEPRKIVAERYGISVTTVYNIRKGILWAHL